MRLKVGIGLLAFGATSLAQVAGSGSYAGPSILSRGVSQAGRRGAETLNFRFFAQVNGLADSGLLPIATDERGDVLNETLFGVQGMVGAYGYHAWRRSTLGLDYRGDYRHFTRKTYFDGSDHFLSLDYNSQLSKRVAFTLRPTIGTTSRAFGNFGIMPGTTLGDSGSFGVPVGELFDNRTNFVQGLAQATYQKSARLSFNFGGQGFMVRRQSSALVDLNGYTAIGDVAYRLSRNRTMFLAYNFIHFEFPGMFGSTDAHVLNLGHSMRIGRRWQLSLAGGAIRLESTGLRRVAVDPLIARLVGQASTIEAFYRRNMIPSIDASLRRDFRKSSATIQYSQGLSPGNGLFLTARMQRASAGYSYTGLRHWTFGGGFGYFRFSSIGFWAGTFDSIGGGGHFSYRLSRLFHLNGRIDLRQATLQSGRLQRDAYRASLGITFTPGDIPVSIW